MNCVLWILNSLSSSRKRYRACILVDSTDITSNLNWIRRKKQEKTGEYGVQIGLLFL